jgi:hypothetical protein
MQFNESAADDVVVVTVALPEGVVKLRQQVKKRPIFARINHPPAAEFSL